MAGADPAQLRRVYGKGFVDGLKARGINIKEQPVNQARLQQIEQTLSGIEKKVFDCTPMQESWTANRIAQESIRNGQSIEVQRVAAILNQLVERKIVKEPERGKFRRVEVKEKVEVKDKPALAVVQAVESGSPLDGRDPIDKLAEASKGLRALSAQIAKAAEIIDEVALDIAAESEQVGADAQKLRQLQALLKSLG